MTKATAIKASEITRGIITDRGTVTYVEVTHRNVFVRFDGASQLHMFNHYQTLTVLG